LALGFLATTARSNVLTLTPPADLVPGLVDALEHLTGPDAARLAAALRAGGAVSARRDLLHEMVRVAIDEAGERVGQGCTRLVRGEGSASELRALVAQLSGLLDLLARLGGSGAG
jgi:hypothetical protein